MQRILFITFFLLINLATVKAQTYYPLVDTNSLWSTLTTYQDQEPEADTYFTKFEEDTVINTFHYFTVFKTYDSTLINWTNNGYIREDSNEKIYYKAIATQPEALLYDFNHGINDTINIFSVKVKVDSIDSINISGKPRKRFYLSRIPYGPLDIWIEGIGSLLGVLNPQFLSGIVDSRGHALLCFTENDTLKYVNPEFNSCYQLIDNVFELEKDNINFVIFPNPANNYFVIQSLQQATIEILNIQGQTILQQQIQPASQQGGQGKTNIDISGLAKGVYILRMLSNDRTEVARIVKE
ncbi:MAG: T9SS type A sorting domain-containing protein [Bacteroidales bacterium]|jgi:hypothetical protein